LSEKKKIIFLTGTRADFGKLKPLIDKIHDSSSFESYIFATGMHTLLKYGRTYQELEKRGYSNLFVYMNQTHTTDQDTILANTITGFGNFVKEVKPDLIVIHGDRVETLAGSIVGSFNNILVAHIEGGEISGTIDEAIRHSVTKLSHVHFVSNDEAKNRLIQMGEMKEAIFVIGSPDIEIMLSSNLPTLAETIQHYDLEFDKFSILIFHPVATELVKLEDQVKNLISAVLQSKKNYIVIYPNNDEGTNIILNQYEQLRNNSHFRLFPSIRFENFLTLLKNADFIIGNSSAGVREAEVFGIPAINIGSRQKNRNKNKEIINIGSDVDDILNSIKLCEDKKIKPATYFGDGKNTSEKFLQALLSDEIWSIPLQKQFIDLIGKN